MSGFDHCPITLGITLLSAGTTLSSLRSTTPPVGIDLVSLSKFDLMRIASANLVFSSIPQLFMGVMIIYSMRQFERQLGTKKFGSFVFVTFVISVLTQTLIVTTASSMGIPLTLASGPYFFVYSLLTLYHRHIPKLHPSRHSIFGSFRFSEKSWTYVFALQLLLGEGVGSLCAGLSGVLAGSIYLVDIFGLQKFRLPKIVETICSPFSFLLGFSQHVNTATPNPHIQAPPRQQPLATGVGRNPWTEDLQEGFRNRQAPARAPSSPPPEAAIETIMNLGFDRQQAMNALRVTNNNVDAAANYLFSGRE